MTTLYNSGAFGALQSLQVWAFERLVALNLSSGDLRVAVVALVSGLLAAAGNAWFETIATRALQGAHFARRVTAADTMVAAGGR
jgi:hypothetical protein